MISQRVSDPVYRHRRLGLWGLQIMAFRVQHRPVA